MKKKIPEDLYYRLNVISLECCPSGKEPKIPASGPAYSPEILPADGEKDDAVSPDVISLFEAYDCREISGARNVIERIVAMRTGDVTPACLPPDMISQAYHNGRQVTHGGLNLNEYHDISPKDKLSGP
jgi:DNA-binding NtrC family response regulator